MNNLWSCKEEGFHGCRGGVEHGVVGFDDDVRREEDSRDRLFDRNQLGQHFEAHWKCAATG